MGFPGETERDLNQTFDLIDTLKQINPKFLVSDLKILTPYPGSDFYREALELGFEPPKTLEIWSEYHWNNAKLPWLRNKRKYEIMSFNTLFCFFYWKLKKRNILYNSLLELVHFFEYQRWRNRYWKYPFELILFKKYVDLINWLIK